MNDQELELITAVRNDRVVGRNTCSVIDEVYTDAELLEHFQKFGINTPTKAVKTVRKIHRLIQERTREIYNA